MTTIKTLFAEWHTLPAGLHALLKLAGYPAGADGIRAKDARAGDAPARWVGQWYKNDVSGPLQRPNVRLCRMIEVTGPSGTVTGRIVK